MGNTLPTEAETGLPADQGSRRIIGSLTAGCLAAGLSTAIFGLTPTINGVIAAKLAISGSQLNWVGDAMFAGAVLASYPFGSLSDRVGRKRLLLLGCLIAVVGFVIGGLSTSVQVLWAGQALVGIGAGGLGAISLQVVLNAGTDPRYRVRDLALFSGSLAAGGTASALVGGFLGAHRYEVPFYAMAVVSAVVLGLAAVLCRESRAPEPAPIDWAGQGLLALTLFAVLWSVIQGSADGWGNGTVIAGYVVAVVAFVAFVLAERQEGAMLTLSLFRQGGFAAAGLVALVTFFAYTGSIYIFSIRFGIVQGRTPLFVAMGVVLISVVSGVVGYLSRYVLAARFGAKVLAVVGLACFAVADLWFAAMPLTWRAFSSQLGFMVLIGIGMAACIAGMTTVAVNAVNHADESVAASNQAVLRQAGAPVAVAVIGAVTFSSAAGAFTRNMAAAHLPASVQALAAGVASHAGVLGVLESGFGAKVPAVGAAAVTALNSGLVSAARILAIICLVTAVVALVLVPGSAKPAEIAVEASEEVGAA
jgi:MFS family permease